MTALCTAHYVGQKQTLTGERWYRCSGKTEAYPGAPVCDCNGIPAQLVEDELWGLLVGVLSDPDKLREAASEWLEMTADQSVSFEDRIEDLDKQIAKARRILKITLSMTIRESVEVGATDAEAEKAAENAVRPLKDDVSKLQRLRNEVVSWQREAEAAQERVRDLQALADAARTRLRDLTLSEQAEVLALLRLTLRVTEAVPPAPKGVPCPVRAWFAEEGRGVPARVSEEAWRTIEPLVAAGDRPCRNGQRFPHRVALEGILHKVRSGAKWDDVPLKQGTGKGLSSRFRRWRESGMWGQIMDLGGGAVGPSAGAAGGTAQDAGGRRVHPSGTALEPDYA